MSRAGKCVWQLEAWAVREGGGEVGGGGRFGVGRWRITCTAPETDLALPGALSSVRSATFIVIVPTRPGQAPQERHEWDWRHRPGRLEHMPLLRSLAELVAGATISMALLAELFASPWPRQQRARDPCKVQQLAGAFDRCRGPKAGASSAPFCCAALIENIRPPRGSSRSPTARSVWSAPSLLCTLHGFFGTGGGEAPLGAPCL